MSAVPVTQEHTSVRFHKNASGQFLKKEIRPIRIEGDTAFVPLPGGIEAIIDAADVCLVGSRNWCSYRHRYTRYVTAPVEVVGGKHRNVKLHRFLLSAKKGQIVDHVNGNGLDNQRSNLRFATVEENCQNRRTPANSSTGQKGVTWNRALNKWQVTITANRKRRHLGVFLDFDQAVATYCKAARNLHRDFARLA